MARPGINLPKLELQKFSGELTQCPGFWKQQQHRACLRATATNDIVSTQLVLPAVQLVPLRKTSLPRLELMEMLCPTAEWKTFAGNQVQEIQQQTKVPCWAHCLGHENPAGHLTRGITVQKLTYSHTWWCSSKWLVSDKVYWLNRAIEHGNKAEGAQKECQVLLQMSVKQRSPLFNLDASCSYTGVPHTTAWIHRFVNNYQNNEEHVSVPLTAGELQRSEVHCV